MNPSLTTAVLLPAALLLVLVAILAIRSGRILWYPAFTQVNRSEQPWLFWTIVVAQLVAAAALSGVALS